MQVLMLSCVLLVELSSDLESDNMCMKLNPSFLLMYSRKVYIAWFLTTRTLIMKHSKASRKRACFQFSVYVEDIYLEKMLINCNPPKCCKMEKFIF